MANPPKLNSRGEKHYAKLNQFEPGTKIKLFEEIGGGERKDSTKTYTMVDPCPRVGGYEDCIIKDSKGKEFKKSFAQAARLVSEPSVSG